MNKWSPVRAVLGGQRCHVVGTSADKDAGGPLRAFLRGPKHFKRLLIVSYEQCRKHAELLAAAGVDLLVLDEGHRLKASGGNLTITAVTALRAKWRLLISATPVQNDLSELWALVQCVLPDGPLGSLGDFRRHYVEPIESSRIRGASEMAAEIGRARLGELSRRLSPFTLRRDTSVLASFLPSRREVLLFAPMHDNQRSAYDGAARAGAAANALGRLAGMAAACTHPAFAVTTAFTDDDEGRLGHVGGPSALAVEESGKLRLLHALLQRLLHLDEKVVIVCRLHKTMDVVAGMCTALGVDSVRLDGRLNASLRQGVVSDFNVCAECRGTSAFKQSGRAACHHARRGPRVLLITARAGGVGLTATAASRLLLLEPDWYAATRS